MTDTESFERAFVAVAYLLGRRTELPMGLTNPGPAARHCAERLALPEQVARARRLAAELAPIVVALDARRPT
jgi:hypothetical protein